VVTLAMSNDGRMEVPGVSIERMLDLDLFRAASRLIVSMPD
jgi:hypothetical protein